MDSIPGHLLEMTVVNLAIFDHVSKVDGTQVTGLVRQQRLLAARVGALDLADGRGRIVAVHHIEKDQPRFAILPGRLDNLVKNLRGGQTAHPLSRARIDQVIVLVVLHRLHELIGGCH